MKKEFNNSNKKQMIAIFYSDAHHALLENPANTKTHIPCYRDLSEGGEWLATKAVKCSSKEAMKKAFAKYKKDWPDAVLNSINAKFVSLVKLDKAKTSRPTMK